MTKIDKDKTVSYATGAGKTTYNHASLANVTEKINEALRKCGLSASWQTKQNGGILVTCKITHIQGHSEETTLSAPSDTSGSKNAIQAIGSTITYLERYTLLALTGLATYDQDDDGRASGASIEYIDDKQLSRIRDYIDNLKYNLEHYLLHLHNLMSKDYNILFYLRSQQEFLFQQEFLAQLQLNSHM